MSRRLLQVYLGLIANVLVFYHKPLFSENYIFPWDFRYVQLPMVSFLAEELQRGKLALWDPFTYCGNPIFANIQAGFFHPLVAAGAWLSAHTTLDSLPMILEWVVVLQICFAGIVAFHLFRQMGAGMASAFAGAIIFETGGYFVSQTEHIGAVMSVAWMPLAWLSVLRLSRDPGGRWLAVLAVALGMSVLGGLPPSAVAVFGSTVALSIVVVLHGMSRPRLIGLVLAGCGLGLGLAAIQFIPTAQLTGYSVAKYRADWLGTGGGLYWQSFVSLVAPNHYHLFDLSQFKGPGDISFLYLYGSLAGLGLVLYCLVLWIGRLLRIVGRMRSRLFDPQALVAGLGYTSILAVMMFFGAFWALGDKTAVWRAIFPLLPVSIRIGIHPEFTSCNFTLPFAGLAALGLERLPVRDLVRWGIALVMAVDLFLAGSGRPMNCTPVSAEPGLTNHAFDGSTDLLESVRQTVNRDFPPARIDTMEASINWAECATLTRVPAANGSSPLAPEDVVRVQMLALAHPGVRWGWFYPVENLDSPVLDIMNVKFLLAGSTAVERVKSNARYRRVASLPGNELFENLTVLPRYFLVTRVRQASMDEAERLIQKGEVDLQQTALTEVPVSLRPDARGDAPGSIRAVSYEPDSLALEVTTAGPSFLVLSESFYPGWKAWIDDRPSEVYRTDMAFRGLVVPAGKHRIRMQFRPVIFFISLGVSMFTVALVAAVAFFGKRQARGAHLA